MKLTQNDLILTSTNLPDAGIYQCIASNAFGIASAAGHLFINDSLKPSSPISVRCKPLNSTTVHVSWDISDESELNLKPPIIIKSPGDDTEDPDHMDFGMLNDDYTSLQIPSRIAYTINYYPTGSYRVEGVFLMKGDADSIV